MMTRRSFLKTGAAVAASMTGGVSCSLLEQGRPKSIKGAIKGANWRTGHKLKDGLHPSPDSTEKVGVVIAGGGIAGLSAAWELQRRGFNDFVLLELDDRAGGNSRSGSNEFTPYPWGAHYLPLPGDEAVFVKELLEEIGAIERYDRKGLPVYNDYYLCSDPQERLFIQGQWQEGLLPQIGVSERDKEKYRAFFEEMERFKNAKGKDGRRAFAIPMEFSSRDDAFLRYDRMSMAAYMTERGWDSKYLLWYVNYCCRDDYGCGMEKVSAWAGIHYFASRGGRASNADPSTVLTWPEGNGWLANKMAEKLKDHIRCNSCVLNVEESGDGVAVEYLDTSRNKAVRLLARSAIMASPRFAAARIVKRLREESPIYLKSFSYAPWMVANITLDGIPEGKGFSLAWDNVSFHSRSLGYVDANHQDIRLHHKNETVTYYLPLDEKEPAAERKSAMNRPFDSWVEMIVNDLSGFHPGIDRHVKEMDVWIWGHAMIRPLPGFIWGQSRGEALKNLGNIFFAHSDMSGISIFEEAQYRGVMAARGVLDRLRA